MSSVSTIYQILDGNAGLELMVADHIYLGNFPSTEQGTEADVPDKYVILEEITTTPANVLKGNPNTERAIIQIDIICTEYRAMKEIRDAIREILRVHGTEIESGSQWEPEVRKYRETMEWSFWLPR